jgi:twitching motility protein PilT
LGELWVAVAGAVAPDSEHLGVAVEPRLDAWLAVLHRLDGSDLLLHAGSVPQMRVGGRLAPMRRAERLTGEEIEAIARAQADDRYGERLHLGREVNFAFTWRDLDRIRANAFYQSGACTLVLRRLPLKVPTLAELGLPDSLAGLLSGRPGLLVVTGPSGSGRTTTAAALIGAIHRAENCHIVTIEDPVEYVHGSGPAVLTQRQIGRDTESLALALRAVRRETADVVLVDELREPEDLAAAVDLADSGRRVIAVMAVEGAAACVDRLIDYASGHQRQRVKLQLASSLLGIVYQRLVPRTGGGSVVAHELLVGAPAVRRLIRDSATPRLRDAISADATGGMRTMERSLTELIAGGQIDPARALEISEYPQDLSLSAISDSGY